jgi:hypothetical protein
MGRRPCWPLAAPRLSRQRGGMIRDALERRAAGILTYGLTPPKRSTPPDKRAAAAARQLARISELPVDALVLYDIQDESARTDVARPFPFLESTDPTEYAYDDLASLALPKIVYRSVVGLSAAALRQSLSRIEAHGGLSVFVGAASKHVAPKLKLSEAYELARRELPALPVGGVLIAERHSETSREDERVRRKLQQGCRFFVTQAVYSAVASKNVLSDLYFESQKAGQQLPPILITLSPCGSLKTLEFMRWLGISVPRWIENELLHAKDILRASVEQSVEVFRELHQFAASKGIPLGCNVESVSLRKEEIDASVELVHAVARILGR